MNQKFLTHLYRTLLYLYPRGFQAEFAAEMQSVFAEVISEAAIEGLSRLFKVVLTELFNLPGQVLRQHYAEMQNQGAKSFAHRAIWEGPPSYKEMLVALAVFMLPAVFIWYLNAGGTYAAIREGRLKTFGSLLRKIRIAAAVIVPVAIYVYAIWFSLGHYGWQVTLAVGLVLPVVLFVPVLVWATIASGLYLVARDALRRRFIVPRRRLERITEEPALREIT